MCDCADEYECDEDCEYDYEQDVADAIQEAHRLYSE